MPHLPNVAIFWDYENCSLPSHSCGLGFGVVNNISRIARLFGSVTTFRAYLDISAQSSSKSVALRSELQSSGVSIIDCPHNGKKDVVDKMIIVDMLAFAIDHPTPATIILITGDRDYAYAVSILKLRKYQVILVVPSSPHAPPCLESQASLVIDWGAAVLRSRPDPANAAQPIKQPYSELDASLVSKLLTELQEFPPDDPDAASHSTSTLRRVTARDLLEPSRHSKNTESLGSTQEIPLDPESPRNSMTTGLPIPQTPSRSRRGSVSARSVRTRSTTVVTQCSSAVEQYTPVKSLQPTSARRSSTPNATHVANPASRGPQNSTLPDALELSLLDVGPRSPAIVHSVLNPLASPFTVTKAPTEPQPALSQQSRTKTQPASPTILPAKTLAETVAATRVASPAKAIEAPEGAGRSTGLRIENERICEQPIPRQTRLEDACGAADLAGFQYHSCVAPDLHLADAPADEHVPVPTTGFPGSSDSVDSAQFAAPSCASNSRVHVVPDPLVASSGTPPSTLSTATGPHEHVGWAIFKPLIHVLLEARESGVARPLRTSIGADLVKFDSRVYQRAGVTKFKRYIALAEKVGVIEVGGQEAGAWIALHPSLFEAATTQLVSTSVSSPPSDPPKVTQCVLPTDAETSPMECAANCQTPTQQSLQSSGTLPTDRQESTTWHCIPVHFRPLINALVELRAEGFREPRRSIVAQMLGQIVYSQAGVSGFKEYSYEASEAQLIELGGVGGNAWIRLHPEVETLANE